MDTQTNHQRDFADNFWVQTAALLILVTVLLEVAAQTYLVSSLAGT